MSAIARLRAENPRSTCRRFHTFRRHRPTPTSTTVAAVTWTTTSGPYYRFVQRSCDPPRWVGVGPADRSRGRVVVLDVAHQLAPQVGDRGEDASCGDIALDLREPEFHLIEPRGIGGRVVELDVWMGDQEGPDL